METYYNVIEVLLVGLGAILALGGVIFVLAVLSAAAEWLRHKLAVIDSNPALVAFGQSLPGQVAHNLLANQLPKVDEADDPLIQFIMHWPGINQLQQAGYLTAQQVSDIASEVLGNLIKLTDGEPEVEAHG